MNLDPLRQMRPDTGVIEEIAVASELQDLHSRQKKKMLSKYELSQVKGNLFWCDSNSTHSAYPRMEKWLHSLSPG